MDRLTRDKILHWIKEHEFQQFQGGWLIHADDLEAFINKQYDSQSHGSGNNG